MGDGTKWRVRHMEEGDKLESFRCGNPDLDDFLLNDSRLYQQKLLAATYLLEVDSNVMAYFSLANDNISIKDFSTHREFNRFRSPRFVNSKRIKTYPAVKICRFAVGQDMKRKGIGTILLNMIKESYIHNQKSGCRFITVDAYKSAIPFYLRNGFLPLQHLEDNSGTSLMFYDLMNAIK